MDEDWSIIVIIFIMGIILGMLLVVAITHFETPQPEKELGQAICEQEYDLDFDKYDFKTKELYCKEKLIEDHYDGLVIKLKEDE